MTLTTKTSVVTQAIIDLLEANSVSLGLKQVFYGDEELIPKYPSVGVDPGPLRRNYTGESLRTDNNFTVYLMVYHGAIRSAQITRKAADVLAETIVDLLHTNVRLGEGSAQLLIDSLVTVTEPGFAKRGNELLQTTRIQWTGYNKTALVV